MTSQEPFLAAVVCDGMGGLEAGDEAADLAAARAAATLAQDDQWVPSDRMDRAIRQANAVVFERFHGRAGTVVVAVLIEGRLSDPASRERRRSSHRIGYAGLGVSPCS